MHRHILKKQGFTLIELLVVIGIIVILATIVFVNSGSARARANDVARIKQLNDVHGALALYYLDNKKYPSIAPKCEDVNDDNDNGTPKTDDSPACYASTKKPAVSSTDGSTSFCSGTVNYPTCTGYKQSFEDTSFPSKYYGCSGNNSSDVDSCGWGVNRSVYPYEIHTLNTDGTCPPASDYISGGDRLHRVGYDSEVSPTNASYIAGTYPDTTTFAGESFQQSYGSDFLNDTSTLLKDLFSRGYLDRNTWSLSNPSNIYNNGCRYVVLGTEDLDDGNGQPPWNGNVQSYVLFCPLETGVSNAKSDGGYNDTVYEIYSPGTPKICVVNG